MRLLYFYGEIEGFDHKLLNPIEINFSREYEFEPSKQILNGNQVQKSIKITRSKDYIPLNFWSEQGSVYNSTLFVGKNGSGKSTLLQNIMYAIVRCGSRTIATNLLIWQEFDENKEAKICAIVRNNIEDNPIGETIVFRYGTRKVGELNKNNEIDIYLSYIPENDLDSVLNWRNHTKLMYFSNAFSQNDFLKLITDHFIVTDDANIYDSLVYNVSTVKELNDIISNKNNVLDQSNIVNLYWNQKHKEEIEFVFDKGVQEKIAVIREKVENFEIPIPNELTIKTISPLYELNAIAVDDFIELRNTVLVNGNVGFVGELAVTLTSANQDLFKYLIAVQLVFRAAYSFVDTVAFIKNCEIVKKHKAKPITIVEELIIALSNTSLVTYNKKREFADTVRSIKELVDFIFDKNSSVSGGIASFGKVCNHLEKFEVNTERRIIISLKCVLKTNSLKDDAERQCLLEFLRLYNDTLKYNSRPYLGFDWGLSSGEANMLSMLATLHTYETNGYLDNVNTLFLFMDEADIGYHPEWQREWFYIFPRMIEVLFSDKENISIQFIMATHSPLLLGDMPSRCSYFVENDNQGIKLNNYCKSSSGTEIGTFGQNLYTILSDGFFLTNSALGETAIKKSEEIAEAFKLFRKFINMKNNDMVFEDMECVKNEINNKNEEKRTLFEKDCVPYKTLEYVVNKDIKIEYGAYLQYVRSLINLYSGFIKEKLVQEYQYIEWNLCFLDGDKQLELIETEIERLNKLKERIEENGNRKHD